MRKNIIYLHPHFTLPGGAGNFALQTAKYLSTDSDLNIYIISGLQKEELIKDYRKDNLKFIEVKMPPTSSFVFWILYPIWLFKVLKKISELYKSLEGEFILFPQVFPANWWGFIYKVFHKNTKLVFMCHEPSAFIHNEKWIESISSKGKKLIAHFTNPILKKIDIYLTRKSDIILVNSNFTKKKALEIYGRADGVVYPGFDSSLFHINKNLKKEKYIGVLSRLTKFKNVGFVIDLFAEIAKEFPDYTLNIGGEGEEKEILINRVKDLGLESKIIFLNVSDEELPSFYQKAKIVIFASENEPFGIVPVEAMACGTYVVGHNSGGLKETIPNEFRYENKEEALDILKKIIRSENDLNFGVVDKFEWKNCISDLKKYF